MILKLKSLTMIAAMTVLATAVHADHPDHSYTEGGIMADKYYDGGAASSPLGAERLNTFDELDFEVFSGQDWARLHESHANDIVVSWPDGSSAVGLDKHIEDLKRLFIHAPDTQIKSHPVRVATGDWTTVIGVMTGTFTEPMPIGGGKSIEPTGKRFELKMATVAYWQDGVMVHEWLFWDNASYMAQLGLGG